MTRLFLRPRPGPTAPDPTALTASLPHPAQTRPAQTRPARPGPTARTATLPHPAQTRPARRNRASLFLRARRLLALGVQRSIEIHQPLQSKEPAQGLPHIADINPVRIVFGQSLLEQSHQ